MSTSVSPVEPHYRLLSPILSHHEVAPRHWRLKLQAPEIARAARAGQFVHILPRSIASYDPLLRRAFSILTADNHSIEILYRVEGRGTALMAKWNAGDTVDMIGPLGNGFTSLPDMPRRAILVGGGVGVPPMAMLASRRQPHQQVVALVGARSSAEVICREDFARYEVPLRIATDDGSSGHRGFVTDLLRDELTQSQEAVVYACGPLPMLRVVARICQEHAVPCQVSLEENMPCGVGVCNGCVVPVGGAGDDYGLYRRICTEGPVLWAQDIDWQRMERGCP